MSGYEIGEVKDAPEQQDQTFSGLETSLGKLERGGRNAEGGIR